jgi:hypothetical protein
MPLAPQVEDSVDQLLGAPVLMKKKRKKVIAEYLKEVR